MSSARSGRRALLRSLLLLGPSVRGSLVKFGAGAHGRGAAAVGGAPDVTTCSGVQEEWGVCPSVPSCQREADCEFGEWGEWHYAGGCTGVCVRNRDVARFSSEEGAPCSGPKVESRQCLGGEVGPAAGYTAHCEGQAGASSSAAVAAAAAAHGGAAASAAPVDCEWGEWAPWSACSRKCGGGERNRYRDIKVSPRSGGAVCKPLDFEELGACNLEPCTPEVCRDGLWGAWGAWQPCQATCGEGLQWRNRREEVVANACGLPASGSEHEFRVCTAMVGAEDVAASSPPKHGPFLSASSPSGPPTVAPCPTDKVQRICSLGDWSPWSECPKTCEDKQHTSRIRRRQLAWATKEELLERQVSHLIENGIDVERENEELQAVNRSLHRENSGLVQKLSSTNALLLRMEREASHTEGLESELQAERKTSSALRQENQQLINRILDSQKTLDREATHISMLHSNNEDLRNRHMTAHSRLDEFEKQVDDLRASNVALRTSNLALKSEAQDLQSTASRLRLALPVACGTISAVMILVSLCTYVMMVRMPHRRRAGGDDDLGDASPTGMEGQFSRTMLPSSALAQPFQGAAGLEGGSPQRALLPSGRGAFAGSCYGEGSPNGACGSPLAARSPFGARGTLLSAPSSPKALRADSLVDPL